MIIDSDGIYISILRLIYSIIGIWVSYVS